MPTDDETVAGVWVCDVCALVLYQNYDGNVGVRSIDAVPECLNGCEPMRLARASEMDPS